MVATDTSVKSFKRYAYLMMFQQWRSCPKNIQSLILSTFVDFFAKYGHFYGCFKSQNSKKRFHALHQITTWNKIILLIELIYICQNDVYHDYRLKSSISNCWIVIFWHILSIFEVFDKYNHKHKTIIMTSIKSKWSMMIIMRLLW